ncbi:exported hypothetical protein [Candidatus Zixiibacteriota bacterium]|nr:exported hypothetical protein [candidate division Zixibacteria bacterium]
MSKRLSKRFLPGAVVLSVVIALLAFAGCSQVPTQSAPSPAPHLLKRSVSAMKILGDAAHVDTVLSAAEGGAVSLVDVELFFPPDALSSDTLISIDIPDITVFENHFGTAGLQFNVPVKVVMSYRDADLSGINEPTITLAWYNDVTGEWWKIPCTLDVVNKTVTGYLNHFSAYALISD